MSLAEQLQPVHWSKFMGAISDWVLRKSGYPEDQIQWEDQDLAQPDYPYISLKRNTVIREGDQGADEVRTVTDLNQPLGQEIEMINLGPREVLLTVQVHADEKAGANVPGSDPMFMASRLVASLGQQSVVDALKAAGISIIEEGDVTDTSITVNEIWTKRSTFAVRLRVMSFMTERTGYIDAVGITGTLNPGPVVVDGSVPPGTP